MATDAPPTPGTYRRGRAELPGLVNATIRLQREWDTLVRAHFGDRVYLHGAVVLLGRPAAHGALGTTSKRHRDGRLEVVVDAGLYLGAHPDIDAAAPAQGRWNLVRDVLLHEAVHVAIDTTGPPWREQADHGGPYALLADAIGTRLGLPSIGHWAHWPYFTRPADHYLGAYRPAAEVHLTRTFQALLRDLAE